MVPDCGGAVRSDLALVALVGLRYVPGRYTLAGLTLAGAALSAAMALIYQPGVDPMRVCEGTDTRAFGLLIGAALAMVWTGRELRADLINRLGRLLMSGAGVVGLLVIGFLIRRTSEYSPLLYNGGSCSSRWPRPWS